MSAAGFGAVASLACAAKLNINAENTKGFMGDRTFKLNHQPRGCRLSHVFAQLDVPVGEINELLPTVVLVEAEIDLHEWTPLGSLRLLYQMHSRFLRCAIGFASVARDAGANDVFPCRRPAMIARNDVIEIQIFAIKFFPAVLAGVAVALENVVSRELHFLFRHTIISEQQDDARQADAEGDGFDGLWVGRLLGQIVPRGEVVGLK